MDTKETARELCIRYPGIKSRRDAIILALCRGCNFEAFSSTSCGSGYVGRVIAATANAIIEETEQ